MNSTNFIVHKIWPKTVGKKISPTEVIKKEYKTLLLPCLAIAEFLSLKINKWHNV